MWGLVVALAAAAALVAGCAQRATSSPGAEAAGSAPPPTKRVIYMTALEYKGSTAVANEPFPGGPAPAGGGYILKEPVDGRWETSTYRWEPGLIVVYQGDEVELNIWGVNGKEHPSYIEGYVTEFKVKRGQLTTLRFTADKPGLFRIVCSAHLPSMQSWLLVLPR